MSHSPVGSGSSQSGDSRSQSAPARGTGASLPPSSGVYRLGVFGSMMNPPHFGHLAVADAVHRACGLHRVAVVPAGIPPHRRPPVVDARTRLRLAVRAFADLDHVVVSDTEVERAEQGEAGYMVDTVGELRDLPAELGYDDLEVRPTLVVGADQAVSLPSWHRWPELARSAAIAVVARPDQLDAHDLARSLDALRADGARIKLVPMDPVPISSTFVRELARRGDRAGVAAVVPAAIVDDVLRIYGDG